MKSQKEYKIILNGNWHKTIKANNQEEANKWVENFKDYHHLAYNFYLGDNKDTIEAIEK